MPPVCLIDITTAIFDKCHIKQTTEANIHASGGRSLERVMSSPSESKLSDGPVVITKLAVPLAFFNVGNHFLTCLW